MPRPAVSRRTHGQHGHVWTPLSGNRRAGCYSEKCWRQLVVARASAAGLWRRRRALGIGLPRQLAAARRHCLAASLACSRARLPARCCSTHWGRTLSDAAQGRRSPSLAHENQRTGHCKCNKLKLRTRARSRVPAAQRAPSTRAAGSYTARSRPCILWEWCQMPLQLRAGSCARGAPERLAPCDREPPRGQSGDLSPRSARRAI